MTIRSFISCFSFETGGVRLHEANAGLLAHAEVMDAIQDCRRILPVVAVVGSKVGCFGGMGFVAAATDVIIMKKIIRNRIKCKKCGEIIESTSRHDFKFCKCGAVAVDGGKDYLRRVGSKDDYEELIEYEGSDDDEE